MRFWEYLDICEACKTDVTESIRTRYIYSISKRDELRKKAMKRLYEIGIGNLSRFRDWKYENEIDWALRRDRKKLIFRSNS